MFRREVTRVKIGGRDRPVRVHHVSLVVLLIVAAIVLLAAGVFAGYQYSYKTLPKPPLPPGQTVKDCSKLGASQHKLGTCLPQPKPGSPQKSASIRATTQGPDLSNNDPIYGDGPWGQIGSHNSWAIFKVNESTGYIDPTAAPMANYAKRHGLVVGGYDFLHVCGPDPVSEANVFVYHLRADGLTGPGTFPGTGDAEYGGSGCNARSWIATWAQTVSNATGRYPMIYTGAWWWQPHLGSYWPSASLAWISGYGVRYPYMPSGRSTLDIWQFADNGFNGYSSVDLSTWRDGVNAFNSYTSSKPPPPPDPYRWYPNIWWHLRGIWVREQATVKHWDTGGGSGHQCRNPVRRHLCVIDRRNLLLLRGRIYTVATHGPLGHPRFGNPRWGSDHLGWRFQEISRRLK